MKKIMLAVALMVSAMTVSVANAAVSLKSSGDQWGPAVQDLMNAKENGNWNEARFISTFNNRFNGTAEEAKALLNSLKAGSVPSSLDDFNNSISTPNPGNGNGNGNGNNGGSTCTGNPHNCNSGSGITEEQLKASQDEQDKKQLAKDQSQDTAIDSKADKSALNDVSVKTDHAFDIAVEGRATANNALSTVYGLIPQVLDNGKKITDVDNKVDSNKAQTDAKLNTKVDKDTQAARDSAQDDHINAVQGAAQTANDRATDLEHRADAAEGAIRETNDQLAVTDGRSIDNAIRLDGVEAKNDEQDKAIAGKVDKSTYAVDKAVQGIHDALQDGAIIGLEVSKANKSDLNKETADRVKGDKALDDKINKAVSDQASTDNAQNAAIGKEVTDRQNADNTLKNNIDQNKADQAKTDAKQNAAIDSKVDKSTYAVDKAKQAVHDAVQDAAIVGLAVTKADKVDLNKEVAARKDADKVLQSNIDSEAQTRATADTALKNNIDQNKANQAKTDAKQDKALSNETDNRISGDNALKANIDQNKADQAVTDSNQDKVIATKASKKELADETVARQNVDKNLQANIDTESSTRDNADKALKANIDKNKADQAVTDSNQDKVIATKASKKELASETASRKSADAKLSSRIDSNDATLVQHDQRITSNTQRIGSVEGRVSNLEQSTNKRFADVDKRIGDNRKVASAGIAGAGAMANIPGLTQNGNFSVGAGVGGYDGEQAVAVGFNARISQHVTTKVTVSTNTQSEVLWGAGVGVEW